MVFSPPTTILFFFQPQPHLPHLNQSLLLSLHQRTSPLSETSKSHFLTEVARSQSGDFTHYAVSLGACGQVHNDNEAVVAISKLIYGDDANPNKSKQCGRRIRAYYNGKSIDVTVVDKCEGCQASDLDFSPSAFTTLVGSTGPGRVKGTWDWL